jgi:protein subunit release factor A
MAWTFVVRFNGACLTKTKSNFPSFSATRSVFSTPHLVQVKKLLQQCKYQIDGFGHNILKRNELAGAPPQHQVHPSENDLKDAHISKKSLQRYEKWQRDCEDVSTLLELRDLETTDETLVVEAFAILQQLHRDLEDYETETLLNRKYDSLGCMVSISCGLGGDDAEDWVRLLQRMYQKYADSKGFTTEIMEEYKTTAGIKSTLLKVEGVNAYGFLNGEKGTHRLVRISPFNALGKRQTSFAAVSTWPILNDQQDSSVVILDKVCFRITVKCVEISLFCTIFTFANQLLSYRIWSFLTCGPEEKVVKMLIK